MRRRMTIVIGIIVILGIVILSFSFISGQKQNKEKINFSLLSSYEIDTKGIRERLSIPEDAPFTWFFQLTIFDDLQEYFAEQFDLEFPEFDFDYEDKYMAITIGRQIEELTRSGYLDDPYTPNTFPKKLELTFSEEYHYQTMYVYTMDKMIVSFIPLNSVNRSDQSRIYLIKDGKKVFWGNTINEINKRIHTF